MLAASSPQVARRLQTAQARTLAAQLRGMPAWVEADVIEAGGVCAALALGRLGRKLNHVVGLGMTAAPEAALLDRLEAEYARRGLRTEIDLCPHADPATVRSLGERGYRATDFSNAYVRDPSIPSAPPAPGLVVRTVTAADHEALVAASVAGFGVQARPRPPELLEALARSALARSDTFTILCESEGRVAGSAAVSILPDGEGSVAYLHMASTLPEFRGRGVQGALIGARLEIAATRGASLALINSRLDNVSARNAERARRRRAED